MGFIDKTKERLISDIVLRNIVLAISIIIILIFITAGCLAVFTRHGQKHKVPNFSGMTLSQAEKTAQDLELQLDVIDSVYVPQAAKGAILEQYPKPGNVVKSKRRIFLTINTYAPKIVPMPYVAGFSLRQAKNKLTGAGFTIDQLIYRDDIATNNIIEQRYNGRTVEANSNIMGEVSTGVTLVVGLNPVDPDPVVPGIVGLSIDQAKNRLWEAGFNIGEVELSKDINYENLSEARIFTQSIPKSARVMYGRSISMQATLDKDLVDSGIKRAEEESVKQQKIELEREDSLDMDIPQTDLRESAQTTEQTKEQNTDDEFFR